MLGVEVIVDMIVAGARMIWLLLEKLRRSMINQSISKNRLNLLKQVTAADKGLQMIQGLINKGWLGYKRNTPIRTRQYWDTWDKVHVTQGIVFRHEKLVILTCMHGEILTKLHESPEHREMQSPRSPMMYWPGMGQDIEETTWRCPTFTKYRPGNPQEPRIPHEIPECP